VARFSEEEVSLLFELVGGEIYEVQDSHIIQEIPEYLPFLHVLQEKTGKIPRKTLYGGLND